MDEEADEEADEEEADEEEEDEGLGHRTRAKRLT